MEDLITKLITDAGGRDKMSVFDVENGLDIHCPVIAALDQSGISCF